MMSNQWNLTTKSLNDALRELGDVENMLDIFKKEFSNIKDKIKNA